MEVVFWIIAIILLILGIFGTWKCCADECDYPDAVGSFLAICLGVLFVFALCGVFNDKNPKPRAIDVYRGKTTLQITYQDSIPLDTVVVWKDEYKPVSKKK